MIGEIIAIGEEVLAGDIINSNAAVLSSKLADLGVFCRFHSVVGDIEKDILIQLETASQRSDVILISGGLGPTKDDLTKETVAKFLDRELFEDEASKNKLLSFFADLNRVPTENNFKQALKIEDSTVLENNNGTAPGTYVQYNNKHLFLLPGPPNELIPMFDESVKPIVAGLLDKKIVTTMMKLVNVGESAAVSIIDDLLAADEDFIVAPYAKLGEVHLKITALGDDEKALWDKVNRVKEQIKERLGEYIYSDDEKEVVHVVLDRLREKQYTLSTAESCSGGLLANNFIEIPGASDVYMQGAITYSNASKTSMLGVSEETLEKHGAVSEETAREMVEGARERFGTDVALSVTGIAGPDGGTEEKPVGLVYIGVAVKDHVEIHRLNMRGNRDKIRNYSAKKAIILLLNMLDKL